FHPQLSPPTWYSSPSGRRRPHSPQPGHAVPSSRSSPCMNRRKTSSKQPRQGPTQAHLLQDVRQRRPLLHTLPEPASELPRTLRLLPLTHRVTLLRKVLEHLHQPTLPDLLRHVGRQTRSSSRCDTRFGSVHDVTFALKLRHQADRQRVEW